MPDFGSKMKNPLDSKPLTPKKICRKCGNFMNKDNVCESCGNVGNSTISGVFDSRPKAKGEKQNNPYSLNQNSVVINPNQNLSLNGRVNAETIYDSRSDKFITAQAPPMGDPLGGMPPMGGTPPAPPAPVGGPKKSKIIKEREFRHRHVRYDDSGDRYPDFVSKEFKQMTDPSKSQEFKQVTDHPNRDDDEVEQSANDLCIDD